VEHALENVLTRLGAYRYLLAESVRLAEAANALRDECEALRGATYQHNVWLATVSLSQIALGERSVGEPHHRNQLDDPPSREVGSNDFNRARVKAIPS